MALISKPFTFTVGAVIVASEHNSNFDVIFSDYNGNITNVNISGSASIADSKLAQLSSAGKVSGAALTSLGSVPSGAGLLPIINLAAGTGGQFLRTASGVSTWGSAAKVIIFTRNIATASGSQSVTGVGTRPTAVIFIVASSVSAEVSWGFDDGTTPAAIFYHGTSGTWEPWSTGSIMSHQTSGNYSEAKVSAFTSDGCTLSWTKVGTPVGTSTIAALFF